MYQLNLTLSTGSVMWSTFTAAGGSPPSPRHSTGYAFVPLTQQLLIFGGGGPTFNDSILYNDMYSLQLNDSAALWVPIPALGTVPSARSVPSLTLFDELSGNLMLFGGEDSSQVSCALFVGRFELRSHSSA
jgi:hypothetical protein